MPNNLIEVLMVSLISVIIVALIAGAACGMMRAADEVVDLVQSRSEEITLLLS